MGEIPYFVIDLDNQSKVNIYYDRSSGGLRYEGVIPQNENLVPISGAIPSQVETEVYDDDDLESTAESIYNFLSSKYGKLPKYSLDVPGLKNQERQMSQENNFGPIMEFRQWSNKYAVYENSLKDLVGKSDDDELDVDDAAIIGRKISKMKGQDRKKYIGIVNFMGASCRIYNEIWANYKPVDPKKKKSNKGKLFQGESPETP